MKKFKFFRLVTHHPLHFPILPHCIAYIWVTNNFNTQTLNRKDLFFKEGSSQKFEWIYVKQKENSVFYIIHTVISEFQYLKAYETTLFNFCNIITYIFCWRNAKTFPHSSQRRARVFLKNLNIANTPSKKFLSIFFAFTI